MVVASVEPPDPDAALMVAFQKGDLSAFECLLDKYNKPIVNFIYKIVNNRGEAEELAQEVFLRVYGSKTTYEPRARFSSWLYRIATNVSLKALRKREHSPIWFGVNSARGNQSNLQEVVRDTRLNAEGNLVQQELEHIVRQALSSLPQKEKVAVVLRRYEGLSYKEIAEVMNCTEAAVKTYIYRAKIRLRDRIFPYLKRGKL